MVEAPIFKLRLLVALYLLALNPEAVPDPEVEPESDPISDFLVQKFLFASTWPERREATRRAANGDGKREKPRIVKMRGERKGKKVCVGGCGPDLDLETSSVCQITGGQSSRLA
jgi:hypothetical protein